MTKLHVSPDLALPLDWMTLATVVYGARGSGKTTLGSVIAEEVTKAKQRFCAIDLKGDWYGLKSSADGKSEGIPVVVFGGDHQDVPLEEGAGAFIGETIAQLEQPAILDLEHLSKGKQVRFLAAFFERLYDRNRDPLLLLLDEAQRYAPQKPFDPDAAKCLGAVEDLVKLGRKHGIGPMLFTQRGSGLNKEVSELCDMLVAFRTPGPLDQDRVKGWLEANVTREQQQQVMASLSGLATGTAVFASGHPDLKIFGTYPVRRRETFDSSATPKVGHRRAEPKRLAKPDLEQLRTRMADAIERAKAEDPKALRTEIAGLKKQRQEMLQESERLRTELTNARSKVQTKTERVDVPVLGNGALKALKKISADWLRAGEAMLRSEQAATERAATFRTTAGELAVAIKPVLSALDRITSAPSTGVTETGRAPDGSAVRRSLGSTVAPVVRAGHATASAAEGPPTDRRSAGSSEIRSEAGLSRRPARTTEGISAGAQRVLDAIAYLDSIGAAPHDRRVAGLAGVSPKSSTWRGYKADLRRAGLITAEGDPRLTPEGRAIAHVEDAPTTSIAIQVRAMEKLSAGARRVLGVLIEAAPESVQRSELAERAGVSPSSSTFRGYMAELNRYGCLESVDGQPAAAAWLFLEGGR